MSRELTREPAEGQLQLPPGFRFYPSDEELVVHYLSKKAASQPFSLPIIAEVDIYKVNPWDLPEKALFGEKEWYFFSPRDRKYPNGSRPNRAAGSGYWKATGTDKPISIHGSQQKLVGVKKSLVFYVGKPPKGDKTKWIMHEYRLADSAAKAARQKGSLRLDDWVLCRIYKKLPGAMKLAMKQLADRNAQEGFEEVLSPLPEMDDDKKLLNYQPRLSAIPSLINNINESATPRAGSANYSNSIELQRLQQYAANNYYYAEAAAYNYYNDQQQQQEEQQNQLQIMGSCPSSSAANYNFKSPLNHEEMINTINYIGNDSTLLARLDPNYDSNMISSQKVSLIPGRPSLRPQNTSSQNYDHFPINNNCSVHEESALSVEDRATDSFQPFNFDALPFPLRGLEIGSF